jgi:quercetin dioxygenase-like cupin family protein
MEHVVFAKDAVMQQVDNGVSRKVLAYSEDIMPVEVHFEKGGIGLVHSHPHTQVTYILGGVFEFTIDGKQVLVGKGDTLLFPSHVKHGTICLEKGMVLDVFIPYRKEFVN